MSSGGKHASNTSRRVPQFFTEACRSVRKYLCAGNSSGETTDAMFCSDKGESLLHNAHFWSIFLRGLTSPAHLSDPFFCPSFFCLKKRRQKDRGQKNDRSPRALIAHSGGALA